MANAVQTKPIPVYGYDGAYQDHISLVRAERLARDGRATLVRHKGHVNRLILLKRPNDPRPTGVRDYVGQAYSFRQPLTDGHRCWTLRPLQGGRSETHLAPDDLRPIFTTVLAECLVDVA